MYEIESMDGKRRVVTLDVDAAAQAVLTLSPTKPVLHRTLGGPARELDPRELADLGEAVRFQREHRQRLESRATVPPVPAG